MGVMGKMGLMALMNSRRKLSFSLSSLGEGTGVGFPFSLPSLEEGTGVGFLSASPTLGRGRGWASFYFTITSKAPGKVRVIPSGPTATTRVI